MASVLRQIERGIIRTLAAGKDVRKLNVPVRRKRKDRRNTLTIRALRSEVLAPAPEPVDAATKRKLRNKAKRTRKALRQLRGPAVTLPTMRPRAVRHAKERAREMLRREKVRAAKRAEAAA